MQIEQAAQAYDYINGELQFIYTTVVLRSQGRVYHGRSYDKRPMLTSDVQDIKELDTKGYGPELRPEWTIKQGIVLNAESEQLEEESQEFYVKRPSFVELARRLPGEAEKLMTSEIEVCEKLRAYPHPNVVQYHGCVLSPSTGRVLGLCFSRLSASLASLLNPSGHSKVDFITQGPRPLDATAYSWLRGIRRGIARLHSLGLVHNDISPYNVMVDEERGGETVLVDFDSCCKEGEELGTGRKGGTPGWCDLEVRTARFENDWEAVDELETWLVGEVKDLRFQHG